MTEVEHLFEPLVALLRADLGDDLLGVLVTGSRIHGTAGPNSDLDTHVVLARPHRRRRNLVLQGVEVETFQNPAFQIRRLFEQRHLGTLHMFAFGRAIDDPQGAVAQLQREARAIWDAGPTPFAERELWYPRYVAADMLRDLADLDSPSESGERDEPAAALQVARVVDTLLEFHYRLNGRWPAKPKRRLADLDAWSPEAARLARDALRDGPIPERRTSAARLADLVLAPIGGVMPLAWEMQWEDLDAPEP
jgi:hypothetical protein